MLKPKFFTCLKDYSKKQFFKDLNAGLIVAIIAFPLSIALTVSSGASPEKGLLTAIIGCFVVSLLGGSRVQIAGPTGAFIVIVFGIIQKHGFEGLVTASIMAGIILIVLGFLKLGDIIKFIPYPITTGFTSGIAVTIFVSQLKDLFGLTITSSPSDFPHKVATIFSSMNTFNWAAALIALITIIIIIFWPRISRKIPGTLIALVVTTALIALTPLSAQTIGSQFGDISLKIVPPNFSAINVNTIIDLLPSAITIAILAGIESLLSAVVADGMIGGNHRSNMELIATGTANIASGLIGGIPVTGAIARTAANVKNGGRTPVAGILSSIFLLIISIALLPLIKLIPMATLAGVLVIVSWNMGEWDYFLQIRKIPKSDYFVFIITFLLTVFVNLIAGILTGIILASLLFMKRISDVSTTKLIGHNDQGCKDTLFDINLPPATAIYEIRGSFFFGAADKFAKVRRNISRDIRNLIIKMDDVSVIDATALNAFQRFCKEIRSEKTTLYITGITETNKTLLLKNIPSKYLSEKNFYSSIDDAVKTITKDK